MLLLIWVRCTKPAAYTCVKMANVQQKTRLVRFCIHDSKSIVTVRRRLRLEYRNRRSPSKNSSKRCYEQLRNYNMRFSEEQTCKFVDLLQEHECLWNNTIDSYKSRQMRYRAVETIAADMALPEFNCKEVRLKSKSLRSTYHLEVGKIQKSVRSGMATENLYVPSMKRFNTMDGYMKNVTYKRDTIDNLLSRKRLLNGQRKRKHADLMKTSANLKSILGRLPGPCPENEFDAFGRVIALGLKKLKPDLAVIAQSELMAVHAKFQLQNIRPPSVELPTQTVEDHDYAVQTTIL
ncbi:hypothetical protein AVEN_104688-1 [Araneus ventricosus]|uniref:MADF domain-containing protein n=1 Tax=Araneus ventricosus TaxID=182803 RepID=A0A4Y2BBR3_ARAVE|nr:hypothetical protein AVEN_104688-1 [Araneus ventricosus]